MNSRTDPISADLRAQALLESSKGAPGLGEMRVNGQDAAISEKAEKMAFTWLHFSARKTRQACWVRRIFKELRTLCTLDNALYIPRRELNLLILVADPPRT